MRMIQDGAMDRGVARHDLARVDRETRVLEASKLMRRSGATEILVTGEADNMIVPQGFLTAKDIVTRVIATELDPAVVTAGDITWPEIAAAESAHGDAATRSHAHNNAFDAMAQTGAESRPVGDPDGVHSNIRAPSGRRT